MATRLYLNNIGPQVTPSAFRGAWDDTGGAHTRALSATKAGGHTVNTRSESSGTADYDVCLWRGVTDKLAAQTISGTLNLCVGVQESAADADACWHVHAYVMAPDGTVRGTLLADYTETTANEWPPSAVCTSLAGDQTLNPVTCQDGDRIVVELGAVCRNTLTAGRTVNLYYGGTDTTDASPGSATNTTVAWVEFSGTLTFLPVVARVSQVAAEALVREDTPELRVSQLGLEIVSLAGVIQARVSQVAVEALVREEAEAWVSQLGIEAVTIASGPPPAAGGRNQVVIIA